ncbi:MAG: NADH-quinone oxidoreductase subunit H [Solirubrobacteraceae bacterium]
MPAVPDWAIQVLQVLVILVVAPLITGVIARAEAIIQQRHGPRILQPYYDILKLLQKETVLPEPAGPLFRVAPYVSFAAYATVPLLIPVLTTFGLPLGWMADFFGVGMILALASFIVSVAAVDSGSPYAQLGSSRLRSFGAFNEPTLIFVTFVLALVSHTDLPYAFGAAIRSSAVQVFRPSHLLMIAAFFMLVLGETGRIPVENHGGTLEFGQIEEARVTEHSGPGLAFLRWGSAVKQMILFTVLMNVLVVPWGMAAPTHTGSTSTSLGALLIAIGLLVVKALAVGAAIVVVESSFAKLRLYKIPEFSVASFMFAVLAVVIFLFEPAYGDLHLTLFGAASTITAVTVLLLEFGLLRSHEVWEQLRLYSLGSTLVAALAVITAATGRGGSSLYALAAVTIALKALLFPLGLRYIVRRLDAEPRVPSLIRAPSSILMAIMLSGVAFIALRPVHLGTEAALPLSALPIAVGGMLTAFLLMILRPYAPSQVVGFLALENAVTVASLVIAPGLPIILALLLLFDVLVGVLVFVVLVQYLAIQRTAVRTDELNRLAG